MWRIMYDLMYLMHGEVGEENDKVLLHTDYEARVTFKTTRDYFHVVSHTKVLSQFMSWKLKRILKPKQRWLDITQECEGDMVNRF